MPASCIEQRHVILMLMQLCSVLAVPLLAQQRQALISVACAQAIQARKVLRGTVAELVKETRRQESQGEASGVLQSSLALCMPS